MLYVILGYLCDITEFSRTQRITIYVLAIMSIIFRYLMTAVLSTVNLTMYDELFGYNQYHAVLLSMGVFVFFKYVQWSSSDGKIYSIVKYLAGCSYGVYLLHIVVEYQIVERCGLFKGYIYMLIAPLVTGSLCVALVGVIKKIPVLKRLIP